MSATKHQPTALCPKCQRNQNAVADKGGWRLVKHNRNGYYSFTCEGGTITVADVIANAEKDRTQFAARAGMGAELREKAHVEYEASLARIDKMVSENAADAALAAKFIAKVSK